MGQCRQCSDQTTNGFESRSGMRFTSSPKCQDRIWHARTHARTASYYTGARVKRLEREADYSSSTTAEVTNEWIYTSILPIRLRGVYRTLPFCLLKNVSCSIQSTAGTRKYFKRYRQPVMILAQSLAHNSTTVTSCVTNASNFTIETLASSTQFRLLTFTKTISYTTCRCVCGPYACQISHTWLRCITKRGVEFFAVFNLW